MYAKIYLDGNLLADEPSNFGDLEEVIERDENIRGLLPKYPTVLRFVGDGYDYIKSVYDANGFCDEIDVLIQIACNNEYVDYFKGKIFISAVTFNLSKCWCECQVSDNNYGAVIFMNKNIKANVNAPFSKLGADITACPLTLVAGFVPSTGAPTNSFYGVDIYNAFTFLIDFMTEGTIDFISDSFSALADDERYIITVGKAIRVGGTITQPQINVSFQELFVEVNKKYPISFAMELQSNGRYRMRIEVVDYFYKTGIAFSKRYIQDLTLVFSGELLYSQILVGSTKQVSDPSEYSFPYIDAITQREENYYLQTTCNKETELNLLSDFVIDTNVIEAILLDVTLTDYDENIFFVQYTASTGDATQNETIPGVFVYNSGLFNYKVIDRWALGGAVAKYLSNGQDNIRVQKTDNIPGGSYPGTNATASPVAFSSSATVVDYQTEIVDVNNNWTSQNTFTSPADGVYAFQSVFNMTVSLVTSTPTGLETNRSSQIVIQLYLELFDDTNVSQATYVVGYANYIEYVFTNGTSSRSCTTTSGLSLVGASTWATVDGSVVTCVGNSGTISMPQGWYVKPTYVTSGTIARNSFGSLNVGLDSLLYTTLITNGGGVLKPADLGAYRVANIGFKNYISLDEWQNYKEDLSNKIMVGIDNNANIDTWTKKVVRNLKTGEASFELITNTDSL